MKSSRIICAVAAVALGLGSLTATAQGSGPDRNDGQPARAHERGNRAAAVENRAATVENRNWGNRSNDRNEAGRRDDNRRNEYERNNGRGYENRAYQNRSYSHRAYNNGYRDYGRRDGGTFYYGARSPEFRRGGYIPYEYRNRQYYVNDWRSHRLSAPPYGYQWVQVGADYVLIAIATGLIANLILSQ